MTEPLPSDLSAYAGLCELRLVGVDMDGTLLDDQKRFPPKLDELLDELEGYCLRARLGQAGVDPSRHVPEPPRNDSHRREWGDRHEGWS